MDRRFRHARARWAAVLATTALVAGAALLGASGAQASSTTPRPTLPAGYVDDGTLHLQLGATDHFWWEGVQPGTVLGNQSISANRCILQLSGDALASVTAGPAGNQPGFVTDSIGVFGGGSRGTPCGRVEGGESLTVGLTGKLGHDVAVRADLDLEVKADAVVRADVTRRGVPTGTYFLRSGSASGVFPLPANDGVTDCSTPVGDSGPDSGPNDNCEWIFNGLFDSITFSTLQGAFSLEGGSDGAPTGDSLLFLAKTSVTCPSDTNSSISSQLLSQQAGGGTVGGSRGEDAVDPGVCTPIDYDLQFLNNGRKIDFKELGTLVPNATFLFQVTFAPETAPAGDPSKYPPTKFTFDTDPKQTQFELAPCKGKLQFDSSGHFVGISNILTQGSLDLLKNVNGVQYACTYAESFTQSGGLIQVIQSIYLIGDWVSFR